MTAIDSSLTDALRGRYMIDRELGRGGMGTVYLARDEKHDRHVALKLLHGELGAALGPERFLREIKLTARLDHPHILPVLDSDETLGRLWYTMPFVEGESLRDRLRREPQLPLDNALAIAREVGDALDYAHRHGVIHRDITTLPSAPISLRWLRQVRIPTPLVCLLHHSVPSTQGIVPCMGTDDADPDPS